MKGWKWDNCNSIINKYIKKIIFRGEGTEKEGEKHQCVVASCTSPTGHLVSNPGRCSDWELNWQPFGSQACTQSTEPHQPVQECCMFTSILFSLSQAILISSHLHLSDFPPPREDGQIWLPVLTGVTHTVHENTRA